MVETDIRSNLKVLTGLNYNDIAKKIDVSSATLYQRNSFDRWRVHMIQEAANKLHISPERIIDTARFDKLYRPLVGNDLMQIVAGNITRLGDLLTDRKPLDAGIAPRNLNYWRNGIGNPTLASLQRVADLYSVQLADLFKEVK